MFIAPSWRPAGRVTTSGARRKCIHSWQRTNASCARPTTPRVLPGGTAYMTDVGMTGPLESVIGVRTEIIARRFLTELPAQFEAVL